MKDFILSLIYDDESFAEAIYNADEIFFLLAAYIANIANRISIRFRRLV